MHLTLVRHGEAASQINDLGDAGRCLTVLGRDQARATGRALRERGVAPTHAWSSPLVRAVQTAELIVSSLEFRGALAARDDLYPDSSPGGLVAALAALPASADVLVVGHMPYMAMAASVFLDLSVSAFATAEAFRVEIAGPGQGRLQWRFAGRFLG